MATCQFTVEMKEEIKNKLQQIGKQVNKIIDVMDYEKGCLLCDITAVVEFAYELEKLVSFYHFRSSLLPHVLGMDRIIKALAALASKNQGALVVIERKNTLDPYIQACSSTGVFIGAQVSAPLLQAIFYPGNPLHDGAVFIQKEQIVAAGCVLPLSDKKYTNEGKKIGTRHRAAMGITEKTDALALVVSEETGAVSYAMGGVLHPIELRLCTTSPALNPT